MNADFPNLELNCGKRLHSRIDMVHNFRVRTDLVVFYIWTVNTGCGCNTPHILKVDKRTKVIAIKKMISLLLEHRAIVFIHFFLKMTFLNDKWPLFTIHGCKRFLKFCINRNVSGVRTFRDFQGSVRLSCGPEIFNPYHCRFSIRNMKWAQKA